MPLQGLPVLYWGGGGETKLARLPGWRLEVGVVVIGVATIADMNNFPSLVFPLSPPSHPFSVPPPPG